MTEKTNQIPILEIVQKQWKTILFVMLVTVTFLLFRSELERPIWRAKAVLLMAFDDQAASLGGGLLASKADPIKMLGAVLASGTLNDQVGAKIGMNGKKVPFDVRLDATSGQIYITFGDSSKRRAVYTIEAVIDSLKSIEATTGFTTASQEEKNLEKLVQDRKIELQQLEDDFKAYQDNLKTVVAPNIPYYGGQYRVLMEPIKLQLGKLNKEIELRKKQAKDQGMLSADIPTSLPPSIRWRDNLIRLGEELRLAEISSGPEAPNVVRLKQSIVTTKELIRVEIEKYLRSVNNGMDSILSTLITQKTIAEDQLAGLAKQDQLATNEAMQFQHKTQDLMGMRKLLQDTFERYNGARLKAEAQKVRWSVLDSPSIETTPVNKSTMLSLLTGLVVGTILGLVFAIILETGVLETRFPKVYTVLKSAN